MPAPGRKWGLCRLGPSCTCPVGQRRRTRATKRRRIIIMGVARAKVATAAGAGGVSPIGRRAAARIAAGRRVAPP
eukprot:1249214-Pyramimonas_sp.AAC.1